MKKEKQYKDEELIYYRIKIARIREARGNKNDKTYQDKLWCVDCKNFSGRGIVFCAKTLKKAINKLKEELYL